VVQIQVTDNSQDLTKNYDHFLRTFLTHSYSDRVAEYQIHEFAAFTLPAKHAIINNSWNGFDSGICLPSEKYAITYDGNVFHEYTDRANRATNLFLQNQLVKRNLSFVHGAGIELDGKGIVFPAFGGAGKTIAVSALRNKQGFKFYGDDYVIVDSQGFMYSYPCDFSIYDYHINLFPELHGTSYHKYLLDRARYDRIEKLLHKSRLVFPLADLFHLLYPRPVPVNAANDWKLGYVKVPVNEIIPAGNIGSKTRLYASVYLERYSGRELTLEMMSENELVHAVMGILSYEFKDEIKYLQLLANFSDLDPTAMLVKQKQVIGQAVAGLKCYKLLIPKGMKPEELALNMDQIVNRI
jgi:hypothetical protein